MRDFGQDPIRWGIAGSGRIATQFADALALVGDCELRAVASRSRDHAEVFGNRFDIPLIYESYEAMADSDDVDVVYVATSHTLHESQTLLYLEAGKSVVVEKPFALNKDEALHMLEAARSGGLFLMEAMWSRFLPSYVHLMRLLGQGVIGSVVMIEANLGYRTPADRARPKFDLSLGGGSLLDLGVYPTQLCSLVLGQPDHVVAEGHLGKTGVDEQVGAVLHHPGGAVGVIGSSIAANLSCSARIYGTDGTIELPAFMHCPQHLTIVRSGRTDQVDCPNEGNGLQFEAAEVVRCMRAGLLESPIMPLNESTSIMQTLDVVREQIGLVYPSERPRTHSEQPSR